MITRTGAYMFVWSQSRGVCLEADMLQWDLFNQPDSLVK
uniref:Uncharacterized protein n=1 Tax=Anguilla anguilla TaxID=7936 RepID=A0A0E9RZN2_ANGAN